MVLRSHCPSCGSEQSKLFLQAPDFRVSQMTNDIKPKCLIVHIP